MKNLYFLFILIPFNQFSYSQEGVPIKESKRIYVQGNSILIGNNILGHRSNKPLTDLNLPNDLVDMKYINVDNDKTTFSSSEATIKNSPKNTKVKYAAIYWSALYPYKKGVLRESRSKITHLGRGDRDAVVNSILFKTPNGSYEPLNGEIIYDSYNKEAFETNKPYVCFADVTQKLQKLPEINGTYAAANIKATEGKISGGGSAGWLLYIVYEDTTQSPKYFNIYNGMVEVKKDVDIIFKDFKSKEEGEVQTTIAIGALEGDRRLKSDNVSVLDKKSGEYIMLSNKVRKKRNFFNSSITIGDELFEDRNPNSTNTLGFDLLKMEIPNENNLIFDKNTTEASFKFQGRSDRYYLFFFAFETEIDHSLLPEKTEDIANTINGNVTEANIASVQNEEILPGESVKNTVAIKTREPLENINKDKVQEVTIETNKNNPAEIQEKALLQKDSVAIEVNTLQEDDLIRKKVKIRSFSISGLNPGYYIITNAFSSITNAENWSKTLQEHNFIPEIFLNPENKMNYVFIAHNEDLKSIYEKWKENRNITYLRNIWIAEINLKK